MHTDFMNYINFILKDLDPKSGRTHLLHDWNDDENEKLPLMFFDAKLQRLLVLALSSTFQMWGIFMGFLVLKTVAVDS